MKIKNINHLVEYMADVSALIVLNELLKYDDSEIKAKIGKMIEDIREGKVEWPNFHESLGDSYRNYVNMIRNLERY